MSTTQTPVQQTINFVYFVYNFTPGFIAKVWADSPNTANHLQSKFSGTIARSKEGYCSPTSFLSWFMELDDGNKAKLIEWINNNYKG